MSNKVAIILSTFNGEDYIIEQIESILSQKYCGYDLFIHDDGSVDKTFEIINGYSKKYDNINIVLNEKNIGYPGCFIKILEEIKGYQYYAFSDQDDVWENYKLSEAIQCLETTNNSLPVLYYSAVNYTDSNLNFIRPSRFAKGKVSVCELPLQLLLFGGEAMGMTYVFNEKAKDALLKANKSGDFKDWFLKLYCASCGSVYYNPHPSAKYRRHNLAVTHSSNPSGRINRYLFQFKEIFIDKNTFEKQKIILSYIKKYYPTDIKNENEDLYKLFLGKNTVRKMIKKVLWKKRFRSKILDEIGYRMAFFFGRI